MELFTTITFLLNKLYRASIFSSLTWKILNNSRFKMLLSDGGAVDVNTEMKMINSLGTLGHQIHKMYGIFEWGIM